MLLLFLFFLLIYLNKCIVVKYTYLVPTLFLQSHVYIQFCTQVILLSFLKKHSKYRLEHICCLFYFYILNQQYVVFSVDGLFMLKIMPLFLKTNNLYFTNFNISDNIVFFKNNVLLESIVGVVMGSIFEKNIVSTNSLEVYNFNKQYLVQIGFCLLYYIFVVIMFCLIFKNFFLNKEHCSHINI